MAETVFLRRLSRWQADQQREAFADMYVEAYGGVPGEEFHGRRDFLTRFADHVQHPGFDMVIASEGGAMKGCAYGFRTDRGGVRPYGLDGSAAPAIESLMGSGRVFAVVELMVLPSHRRRRVATRLLEQLLARSDAELATAGVERKNAAAAAAWQAWGWTRTAEVPARDGAPGYDIWSRRLSS